MDHLDTSSDPDGSIINHDIFYPVLYDGMGKPKRMPLIFHSIIEYRKKLSNNE
jgi:hypothetical protein